MVWVIPFCSPVAELNRWRGTQKLLGVDRSARTRQVHIKSPRIHHVHLHTSPNTTCRTLVIWPWVVESRLNKPDSHPPPHTHTHSLQSSRQGHQKRKKEQWHSGHKKSTEVSRVSAARKGHEAEVNMPGWEFVEYWDSRFVKNMEWPSKRQGRAENARPNSGVWGYTCGACGSCVAECIDITEKHRWNGDPEGRHWVIMSVVQRTESTGCLREEWGWFRQTTILAQ